jgi:hypothetical protein
MDRAGFDPRYSPEFQRGFDPSGRQGSPAGPEPDERIEPVPEPVVRRIPQAPTTGTPGQTATAGIDDTVLPGEAPGGGQGPESPLPVSPWRNPYLSTLTIVGVVLLAGGVGAFRWAVSQVYGGAVYEGGTSEEEMREAMLAAQLAWGLAPLFALAGTLTLLGVFFFVAWRWMPRPGRLAEASDDASDGSSNG